ncbi:mitochondrial 54S ribosomal protein uL6m [Aspergillus ruber CBS 135680]|uniref:Large ribosomal subunit protein uL6m n=1 Tax=Aspergillus ruber (strain CBS 135680) TaxID=1388766 RepID=A0A017S5N6_ASPRC|nr:putative 60S ribosomal protein L6 [Aspergillus ruber CBS 135680]EYE92141.1 putative 60S ribosomal protein L6 [Aspergillus ruber CBS 135680]
MSCSIPQSCLRQLSRNTLKQGFLPAFTSPAASLSRRTQCFSTTAPAQSRVGGAAISVPPEVSLSFIDLPQTQARGRTKEVPKTAVEIKGPLGQLTLDLPPFLEVAHDEATRKAKVSVRDSGNEHQRAMWGTMRAHLQNYILGVAEGHICILSLVGVGYRASIESTATTVEPTYPGQQFINLKVGFSHPVELGIPEGVKASTPQPTRILLEGVKKDMVTRFAAEIREWRRPEPYKGKGIFINGETIKLKAKKIR